MNTDTDREFGWDDTIQKDSDEYTLLPEGDYSFIVKSFERGRHNGSQKLPPCNKAILKLKVEAGEESVLITHNLFLHSKTEGMLSAFFASIGLKKKGEALVMNWNLVPGATGKAKIGIHKYTNDSGEERKYNDIKKFYPNDAADGKSYQKGKF